MEKDNIDDILNDILKDLDDIKTEDILGSKEKIDVDNDIENTIDNFDISNINNSVDTNLDIEAIINEITASDEKEEDKIDKLYNNIEVFSIDEKRENIPFEQSTDDLSVYFQEDDTKDLLNQEYIAATNENVFFNVVEEVDTKNENIIEETKLEESNDKPEYKEIKVREQKEEMILKKDILFEKAYNDILDLVIDESKKSFNFLEEGNKESFSQLINKLESYQKAKDDIFKEIQKQDKTIFDENIERI